MVNLSKSKYCGLWQCPKIVWLRKYKPEEQVIDAGTLARMNAGNEVGDLAMGLFGDFVEVTAYDGDKIDLSAMITHTDEEMAKGTPIICEASFSYNGLYCAVDILKKENGGWAIYEVKSSTHDDKDVYFADVAYQKYVLEHCGVHVTGTYIVVFNSEYVFDGNLDLGRLFTVTDISREIKSESANVETNILLAEKILKSDTEPDIDLSCSCNSPYKCSFWSYCSRNIPNPSVFSLYRMTFKKKLDCYYKGILTYGDIRSSGVPLNDKQRRQIDYYLADRGTFADKFKIKDFLGTLSYPLYFLDFETMQPVIPIYIGTKPYQQIPFQYSLHYIEHEGGELKHKEFLAESGTDPRRSLAEQLCADIPRDVCVTAYNKAFECTRIQEMADAFPDLADHLINIKDNIKDLLDPFQQGYYYRREMGGSFSIKSVLPAIYPDDPELDYHNLEDIHNGSEAMTIFPQIQFMSPEDQKRTRENLLKYCGLDTYAMVKVWEELVRAGK